MDVIELDLGDVVASFSVRVKGMQPPNWVWRIGAPVDTGPKDRAVRPVPHHRPTGRIDLTMDLQADKKIPLSLKWTDEVGNPTETPPDATATYTVDNSTIINLTDNGDGTAVAAATGTLGTANVHADVTSGGMTLTGDLQIVVVSGLAERVNLEAGDPEEVTPDE